MTGLLFVAPALMLALNAGMRDAEIRTLQWGRLDLSKRYLTVGESKTEAGAGRTIPLNSALLAAMQFVLQGNVCSARPSSKHVGNGSTRPRRRAV